MPGALADFFVRCRAQVSANYLKESRLSSSAEADATRLKNNFVSLAPIPGD
jgi:hypothetical protein